MLAAKCQEVPAVAARCQRRPTGGRPVSDAIRKAAWEMVVETGCHAEVALAMKKASGMGCSDRTAVSILSKQLAPRSRRPLPAYVAEIIVEKAVAWGAHDRVTPLFVEASMRGQKAAAKRPRQVRLFGPRGAVPR